MTGIEHRGAPLCVAVWLLSAALSGGVIAGCSDETASSTTGTASGGGGQGANGSGLGGTGGSGSGAMGGGGSGGCGDITYEGACDGTTLVWCEDSELMTHDCAIESEVCAYESTEVGFNCVSAGGGFGYPVGDKTTYPAGGWSVTQVLGHYLNWGGFVGGHLAQDVAAGSEAETANAPVYSVADGVVLYAGPNGSTYVNVVLIEHDLGGGEIICSFYGHLGSVAVNEGQVVARGDHVANVLDWQAQFGAANSHLHYVFLSQALCAASDAASGALICGYDNTSGPNGITDLSNEPAVYTSVGDVCGTQSYPDAFLSPSQFIEAHHF